MSMEKQHMFLKTIKQEILIGNRLFKNNILIINAIIYNTIYQSYQMVYMNNLVSGSQGN